MKNLLSLLLFSFLLFGCNKGSSDIEKEYIKNLEEKNKVLEKELQALENETNGSSNNLENKQMNKSSKDYFTIGSTEEEVLDVMGDPTSLTTIGSNKTYHYNLSRVKFKNGKVDSYDNFDGNLKIKVRNK
jgi:hypothetical protein